jgi:hypothetical protein
LKILLGNLKDKAGELVEFLEPRVGTKPKASGSEIEIEDDSIREGVKPRHVKTYVKHFLFKVGERKNFRVLVQAKELRLVELEREEEEEEGEKKTKAEPPESKQEEAAEKAPTEGAAAEAGETKEETPEPEVEEEEESTGKKEKEATDKKKARKTTKKA